MRVRTVLACSLAAALALSAARGARAQGTTIRPIETSATRAPEPSPAELYAKRGVRGIELMARGGYAIPSAGSPVVYAPQGGDSFSSPGDVFSGKVSPYTSDLSWGASVGYRIAPLVSAGLFVSYQTMGTSDVSDGTSNLQRAAWRYGAYGRLYAFMVSSRVQPWLQIGVAYANDRQTYVRPLDTSAGPSAGDWTLEYTAIAVPVAIGLDLRVAPVMSLGPVLEYTRTVPIAGCVLVTASTAASSANACSNRAGDAKIVDAKGTGGTFFGLFAKWTFGVNDERSERRE